MRFTEELERKRYASRVMHSLIPPQKIFDLAEVLSSRMLLRTEGRMWMGTHIRRGDCKYPCTCFLKQSGPEAIPVIRLGWVMERDPKDHIQRVKERLQGGRSVLIDLHNRGYWTTCDIEDVQPDLEQTALPPPRAGDPFFVATDERDPETRRKIADEGAVFMSDLLSMQDRQAFGWSLMITDVMALVEQQVLARSGYFYGHSWSSFSGVIVNMRAGRGADPRTMLLD